MILVYERRRSPESAAALRRTISFVAGVDNFHIVAPQSGSLEYLLGSPWPRGRNIHYSQNHRLPTRNKKHNPNSCFAKSDLLAAVQWAILTIAQTFANFIRAVLQTPQSVINELSMIICIASLFMRFPAGPLR